MPRSVEHVYRGDLPTGQRNIGEHEIERNHMVSPEAPGLGAIRERDRDRGPSLEADQLDNVLRNLWLCEQNAADQIFVSGRAFMQRWHELRAPRDPKESDQA